MWPSIYRVSYLIHKGTQKSLVCLGITDLQLFSTLRKLSDLVCDRIARLTVLCYHLNFTLVPIKVWNRKTTLRLKLYAWIVKYMGGGLADLFWYSWFNTHKKFSFRLLAFYGLYFYHLNVNGSRVEMKHFAWSSRTLRDSWTRTWLIQGTMDRSGGSFRH